jgi:precorrin-8X/cobalt-precorrin-8 methylmutase
LKSIDLIEDAEMVARYDYVRKGAEIYRRSFAVIRAEADLARFSGFEERIAVRVIHACGMVEISGDLSFSKDFTVFARAALSRGAPILCDAKMVANGITRARLPANNEIVCTLDEQSVPAIANRLGTTRTAAATELWRQKLGGALVVIGNAPTALFHVLEMVDAGAERPAAIIGMPVGFVGAAEAKLALSKRHDLSWAVVHGRKGGSAMAAAAVNALAREQE